MQELKAKSYWFILYNAKFGSYGERRLLTHIEASDANHSQAVSTNDSGQRWVLDAWRNAVV